MKKIMVIGVSAGVGKSTFAKKLGRILNINVYHLDQLYWKANWQEASFEEFCIKQAQLVKSESWIIEGNYSDTFSIRENEADTIIYLQLPLYICVYRVFARFLQHRGTSRPDMTSDCPEKLDWPFLSFILTTYHKRKLAMVSYLEEQAKTKHVIILKSRKEVHLFLNNIKITDS
ncbi:topology modulation protein [Bacillus sp. HMF5848]|uniref:topology modulation protein n=1 Tax=Bacillus sp. HMF5848 TaxID=2495421 RepID=UPI000F7A413D|nr:topology modulation protein [Bacillus sp. HMF5848]RSK28174.1 topology modulation protein [Bacillus sp. HMF5848]